MIKEINNSLTQDYKLRVNMVNLSKIQEDQKKNFLSSKNFNQQEDIFKSTLKNSNLKQSDIKFNDETYSKKYEELMKKVNDQEKTMVLSLLIFI